MKIGIIGAMNEEIELMKQDLKLKQTTVTTKISFYEGVLEGKEVVLCKSGVGKVNAAITSQVLVNKFQVDCIIFTGVAGALDPILEIGDIVISTTALQHDIDASPLGFKRGEIPMFEHPSVFEADTTLVSIAEKAASKLEGVSSIKGCIVSGDQFIANEETVKVLHSEFGGKCVEMEGSAVAQVAMLNDIPYVIIRSMSDKANGEATMSFTEFTEVAAKQSYLIVKEMVKHL
ncbi:5'-methylthioadenosine/adenosylhomocysteine nucleosidase [Bacillus sp. FJAT-45350]|uniref:5'-methylthioadenosine/adenosylhomocysteine nucleosidase n=1 Tax=Bacillus sp. FJAT-45350 TaxID=2011014 RepID=UPI000BB7DEC3|nr:5'-methylthioadenosine/adenosylhomocysteine nucleosidase [Bacillus sp. FJAT-45350]